MTVKEIIPLGKIGLDHKLHREIVFPSKIIWKKLSEVYYLRDNQESPLGTEKGNNRLREGLSETCWGVRK